MKIAQRVKKGFRVCLGIVSVFFIAVGVVAALTVVHEGSYAVSQGITVEGNTQSLLRDIKVSLVTRHVVPPDASFEHYDQATVAAKLREAGATQDQLDLLGDFSRIAQAKSAIEADDLADRLGARLDSMETDRKANLGVFTLGAISSLDRYMKAGLSPNLVSSLATAQTIAAAHSTSRSTFLLASAIYCQVSLHLAHGCR